MCIDCRKLNLCTEKDEIPLPRTDDVLEALGGGQWFSCPDLASGYWQMQVKEEDRPKTAFLTHRGHSNGGLCHLVSRMGQLVLPD